MVDKISEIEVDGIKYPIVFNLNVMERIQEQYKTIQKWSELIDSKEDSETDVKALKFGIGEMINEGIDMENDKLSEKREMLSEKQIGRIISKFGFAKMTDKAKETIIGSTNIESKNE